MKNYKLPLLGFALGLLITSCRKHDVQMPESATKDAPAASAKISQWNPAGNWGTTKSGDVTTYYSNFTDSSVTADVAKQGMVLVFKKTGNDIQSLPVQDKATNTYWYYQVAKGSIRVNADNSAAKEAKDQSFSYFVITPQQLSDLQPNGKTKLDLLALTYEQAVALLK